MAWKGAVYEAEIVCQCAAVSGSLWVFLCGGVHNDCCAAVGAGGLQMESSGVGTLAFPVLYAFCAGAGESGVSGAVFAGMVLEILSQTGRPRLHGGGA